MKKLRISLESLAIKTIGNRVTLATELFTGLGIYTTIACEGRSPLGPLMVLFGASILRITDCGSRTVTAYRNAKDILERKRRLPDGFFRVAANQGYCYRQGAYLIAKELGQFDRFKESIQDKDYIIPNF